MLRIAADPSKKGSREVALDPAMGQFQFSTVMGIFDRNGCRAPARLYHHRKSRSPSGYGIQSSGQRVVRFREIEPRLSQEFDGAQLIGAKVNGLN